MALLAFDRDQHSHQWLPRRNAWPPDVVALAMDPTIPDDTPFPPDAYITVEELREIVSAWAWGGKRPNARFAGIGCDREGGRVIEARIGCDGLAAPYRAEPDQAAQVAMVDEWPADHDLMYLEVKRDWRVRANLVA